MDPDVDVRLPLGYLASTLDFPHALQLYSIHFAPRIAVFSTNAPDVDRNRNVPRQDCQQS